MDLRIPQSSQEEITNKNSPSSCNLFDVFPFQHIDDIELFQCLYPQDVSSDTNISNQSSSKIDNNDIYCRPNKVKLNLNLSSEKFTMLHLNIRSLKKNVDKLQTLLHQMKYNPDVIGLTETKLKDNHLYKPSLPGYTFIGKNSNTNAGGVGFFLKPKEIYQIKPEYQLNEIGCEDLWLEIGDKEKRIIGVVYRHPRSNLQTFTQSFERTIELLNSNNQTYIIIGDFNINLLNNHNDSYLQSLLSLGCSQLVNNSTRFSLNKYNTGTLLDHIYSNLNIQKICHKIIVSDVSDHLPLLLVVNKSIDQITDDAFYKRNMKQFDCTRFNNQLQAEITQIVNNPDVSDIDSLATRFFARYQSLIDTHAPLQKVSKKDNQLQKKPWISKKLLKLIRKKNKLYQKYIKCKTPKTKLIYIKNRNNLNHMIKKAKQLYYRNLFKNSDIKSTWKNINKVIHFKKSKEVYPNFIEDGLGNKSTSLKDMSNMFNKYFVNVGREVANSIQEPVDLNKATALIKRNPNSIYLRPVTEREILQLIKSLNSHKSVPMECSPIHIIKNSAHLIAPILTMIFNHWIQQGVFPSFLKKAQVTPIFKAGQKSKVSNFRPISLLDPFSKLFEQCLSSRIQNFFSVNNLLYKQQFGFCNQSSTENALTQLYDQLLTNLNNHETVCSIFLDLKKAFDSIHHSILLAKLEIYGIRGLPYKLIQSFLSQRQQYTMISGNKSETEDITCGVPQGSTLSPILFLIYINDFHLATTMNVNLFADDAQVSASNSSPALLESYVNEEFKKIFNWLNANQLCLNVKKTSYIIFSNKKSSINFNITIGNQTISRVTKAKYLGITIDQNLTWRPHIQILKGKLASACWALYNLKSLVSSFTLKSIYYALVYQHLQYGISCWGSAAESNLQSLITLQKRSIRYISNASRLTHSEPLFYKLGMLKLNDIYRLQISNIMFKYSNNIWKGTFDLNKIKNSHTYSTRFAESKNYYLKRIARKKAIGGLSFIGPRIWSEVPVELKKLNSFTAFKIALKNT